MKWLFYILFFISFQGKSQQVIELCPNTQHIFTYDCSSSINGTWYWIFKNDTIRTKNLTVNWSDTGNFIIKVFFNDGYCNTINDSYNVLVKPCGDINIYFPNSFTPNGDGLNDTWSPISAYVKDIQYSIFNRWGQMVFQSNSINKKWNGYFNSYPSPTGVYILSVSWIDVFGVKQHMKGFINLIR